MFIIITCIGKYFFCVRLIFCVFGHVIQTTTECKLCSFAFLLIIFITYCEDRQQAAVRLALLDRKRRRRSQHKLCRDTSDRVSDRTPKEKHIKRLSADEPVMMMIRQFRDKKLKISKRTKN